MEKIQLEGVAFEPHFLLHGNKFPTLLERWKKGEGYIPSEGDLRLLVARNISPNFMASDKEEVAERQWGSSTQLATKENEVKIIFPYEHGSKMLTKAAEHGLALNNSGNRNFNNRVHISYNTWEELVGPGVYTMKRSEFNNKGLTEKQAVKNKPLLRRLGHPDWVDREFARPAYEVAEIIGRTFEIGKERREDDTMMAQELVCKNNQAFLYTCHTNSPLYGASSFSGPVDKEWFPFISPGNANDERIKAQLQTLSLEGVLNPEQISIIKIAFEERDKFYDEISDRSGLNVGRIYSAIESYLAPKNRGEVRKIIDKLTSQKN